MMVVNVLAVTVDNNGAGKTTTISCILNALFKDSGAIKILGSEMTDNDSALREELGVVFDAGSFPDHLDARYRYLPSFSTRMTVFILLYTASFAVSYRITLLLYLKKEF